VPRPRTSPQASYSHGQASYVLDRLVSERRISPGEVARYINDMQSEINDLERRLEALRAAATGGGMSSGGGAAAAPAPRRRGRPPGSGRKAGRPPGRPPGRPGRPPGRPPAAASPVAAPAAKAPDRRRRRSAITPEQLASRQLQGRYLGLIRQIPATRRAQYQRIAKERGREAAIGAMMDTLKK